MNPQAPSAETILSEAIEIADPISRRAYLDHACGADAAFRERVGRLVENHFQAGSFLQNAAVGSPDQTATFHSSGESGPAIDARIGSYTLREVLGEGGMGLVFVAEQIEPVRRKVALKVIKPGMDSRQVVARFEAERQALALMDHPNIARVLDGGTTSDGRPYFVMDLVKGEAVTEYCDRQHSTVRQRLDLFLQVCAAVQHAHQKGVIHRDLKPSNILVTVHDVAPVAKVIDFGVAKALGQSLTDKTLYTGIAQLIGTPLYMSPEQAGHSGLDVDTRTDVYALGVLLYELLTGTTPFDGGRLRAVGLDEFRRVLREEEPIRPSTRLSTLAAAALSTLAERRGVDPRRLAGQLRGDLDWVVMRCLEKDRGRRYESASALAADVQRYLDNQPVEACPPSSMYRLRKFAWRNQIALVTSGLVAAALLIGTAVSIWQAVEATDARRLADNRLESEKLALKDARINLEHAELNLDLALEALDAVYMKEIEQRVGREGAMTPADSDLLRRGLSFYEKLAKSSGENAGLQRETAKANRRIGFLHIHVSNERSDAAVAFRKAIPMFESLLERSPGGVEYRSELSACHLGLAIILVDRGDRQEAERLMRLAVAARKKLVDEFPRDRERRAGFADSLARLGYMLKHTDAEEPIRQSLTIFDQLAAEYPQERWYRVQSASIHQTEGIRFFQSGQGQTAEPHFRKAFDLWVALVAESPKDSFSRQGLAYVSTFQGHLHLGNGKLKEAEVCYQKSVALHQQLLTELPTSNDMIHRTAQNFLSLAHIYRDTKRPLEAEKAMHDSLGLWTRACVPGPFGDSIGGDFLLGGYRELAQMVRANGKEAEVKKVHQDAENALRNFVATFPESLARNPAPANRKRIVEGYRALIEILRLNGGTEDDVVVVYREQLRLLPEDAEARKNLAAAIVFKEKWEEALAAYREALRNPTDSALWPALDGTLKNKVTPDELAAAYKEALRLHPRLAANPVDGAHARRNEMTALQNLGRNLSYFPEKKAESFKAFEAALQLTSDYTAELLNEVVAQALGGESKQSIASYEVAIRNPRIQIKSF